MVSPFTFQYVSINTAIALPLTDYGNTLHSNMFLLIPGVGRLVSKTQIIFTFQYVSINTHLCEYG